MKQAHHQSTPKVNIDRQFWVKLLSSKNVKSHIPYLCRHFYLNRWIYFVQLAMLKEGKKSQKPSPLEREKYILYRKTRVITKCYN